MPEQQDPLVIRSGNFIDGATVAVHVATGGTCFVHKSLLERRAPKIKNYFRKQSLTYDLTLVDQSEVFELYVHYLYTGEIQCKDAGADVWDEQNVALVDFYVLAEKLGDGVAMHAAMRALLRVFKVRRATGSSDAWPENLALQLAHDATDTDSPLCRMMVDLCVWCATPNEKISYLDLPQKLANAVMRTAFERLIRGESHLKGADTATCCDYHQLEGGQQCGSKKRKRSESEE